MVTRIVLLVAALQVSVAPAMAQTFPDGMNDPGYFAADPLASVSLTEVEAYERYRSGGGATPFAAWLPAYHAIVAGPAGAYQPDIYQVSPRNQRATEWPDCPMCQ